MADHVERFFKAIETGDRDQVRLMLAADRSLARATNNDGFTALHHFVGHDDRKMLELLIGAGADVGAKTSKGMTPLHLAKYRSAVQVLMRHGADLNARGIGGLTPLHVQTQLSNAQGALEVMKALLEAGADANALDDGGLSPLDFARDRNDTRKINLLLSRGAKDEPTKQKEKMRAAFAQAGPAPDCPPGTDPRKKAKRLFMAGADAAQIEQTLVTDGVAPTEAQQIVNTLMEVRLGMAAPEKADDRPCNWLLVAAGMFLALVGMTLIYLYLHARPDDVLPAAGAWRTAKAWGAIGGGGGLAAAGLNISRAELMRLLR